MLKKMESKRCNVTAECVQIISVFVIVARILLKTRIRKQMLLGWTTFGSTYELKV